MDDGLFELNEDEPPAAFQTIPARDEQIAGIRERFEALPEMCSMGDRKSFIEDTLHRSVDSLRSLTAIEARRVIDRLKSSSSKSQSSSRSGWDDRDHDTWIDKL